MRAFLQRWGGRATVAVLLASSVAQAADDTVRIGALLAVTGPAAFLGAPEARTLQMLVEQANARGGLKGKRLELLIRDTGASPEKAISFAKQLIHEDKVFAIIGPSTSGESLAIKNVAEEGRTILLSCAAAEAIVQPVAKHVFKTPQKDHHAVVKIFQQMGKMGIKRIGVLSSNTGFGKAGKEFLERLAPEHGIQIAASEVYDKAATDLSAEVTKIRAADVQAIVNWSIEPAQAIVIKNARQLGMTIPIFQSHGFGNIQYVKAAGVAAEGVLFPAGKILVTSVLPDSDPQKKVLLDYTRSYQGKYQEEASAFGGYAYDAFLLLARAVDQEGLDREKVRAAIENTRSFVGTSGIFNFSPTDHNGLGLDAFEMVTVKDGKFAVLGK